jgi:hypothetical protein
MLVAANHADNSIFLLRASDGVSSCLHRASLERAEATCGSVVAGHGVIPTLLTFCRRNVARRQGRRDIKNTLSHGLRRILSFGGRGSCSPRSRGREKTTASRTAVYLESGPGEILIKFLPNRRTSTELPALVERLLRLLRPTSRAEVCLEYDFVPAVE